MTQSQLRHILIMCIMILAVGACEKKDAANREKANVDRIREALPGVRVETADPHEREKLGPSAVPGIIPEHALAALRKQALAGDGTAAYALVEHYDLVGNEMELRAWARIGAENGEYNSMMLMGFDSQQTGGLEACVRAVYWFTRAKSDLEEYRKATTTNVNGGGIEAQIQTAEEEIAKARKQFPGC
jgi:hypothetical protein